MEEEEEGCLRIEVNLRDVVEGGKIHSILDDDYTDPMFPFSCPGVIICNLCGAKCCQFWTDAPSPVYPGCTLDTAFVQKQRENMKRRIDMCLECVAEIRAKLSRLPANEPLWHTKTVEQEEEKEKEQEREVESEDTGYFIDIGGFGDISLQSC
jgi:hypothetical protein